MLKVIDDIFDKESLNQIHGLFTAHSHSAVWTTNGGLFPEYINQNPGCVLVHMLGKIYVDEIVKYFIDEKIFTRAPSFADGFLYIGYPGSSLAWHKDGHNDFGGTRTAISVYLNKEWKDHWGGWFSYKDNNEIKSIIPKYNRAVVMYDDYDHCTTVIANEADRRFSFQLFFEKDALNFNYGK